MELSLTTIVSIINTLVVAIIVPLLKYIWSNNIKQIDARFKVIQDGQKDEKRFWQDVYAKHDTAIHELYDRTKEICTMSEKNGEKIAAQRQLCDERHK